MNKLLVTALLVFAGLTVLCAMLTALTSASASLANGVAHAASSTALMTSQCVGAFMIVVALAAGGVIGMGALTVRNNLQINQVSKPNGYRLPATQNWPMLPDPDDDEDELTNALIALLEDAR